MSTTEVRQASDIDRDIETLRDDELDAVTGGLGLGSSILNNAAIIAQIKQLVQQP